MGSLIRMNVMGGFVAFYLVHLGVVPTLISYPACSNEPYWIVFQSRNRLPAADAVFYRKLQRFTARAAAGKTVRLPPQSGTTPNRRRASPGIPSLVSEFGVADRPRPPISHKRGL